MANNFHNGGDNIQESMGDLDVKTTFLKGDLEKQVFMYQLQGFEVEGK